MTAERGDWVEFHIPGEADAIWGRQRKRVRFLADANVPADFVAELRGAGLDIDQDPIIAHMDDPEVLALARKQGRVLLTFDQDFWSERDYPTHLVPGILIIRPSTSRFSAGLQAMALVYNYFARYFPGDAWDSVKVMADKDGFKIRMRNYQGQSETVQFKLINGVLHFREGG